MSGAVSGRSWASALASDSPRETLARHIIMAAKRGERNPRQLTDDALLHLSRQRLSKKPSPSAERCRCQPEGVSPRIPQRGLRKCCWLRLWIVLRLWMSGVFRLLGTLRNKLRCTLRHLRQQLRHSLRASEIRLRRTVWTDFLLKVPAAPRVGQIGRIARP